MVSAAIFIVLAFYYVYHIAYFFKKSIFDLVFFRHTTTQYLHNIRIFMENLFIYGEVAWTYLCDMFEFSIFLKQHHGCMFLVVFFHVFKVFMFFQLNIITRSIYIMTWLCFEFINKFYVFHDFIIYVKYVDIYLILFGIGWRNI